MLILTAIFTAIIIILVFSILIIVHEFGHFIAAKRAGVGVERFALGFGKKIIGIKKGETEYVVNIIPLGGYVKLVGEDPYERKGLKGEFYSKPIISRLGILLSGPVSNYIFAFLILLIIYMIGTPKLTSKVGMVMENSPAERAGMKRGDKIVFINEKSVKYWEEILRAIREDKEALPLDIGIERDRELVNVTVRPSVISTENIFRQKIEYVGIGIAPSEDVVILKSSPAKALISSTRHVWFFTVTTYKGIWLLLTGAIPLKENVGGPIRIVEILAKAVKYGPISVLNIMATISMALAIFNLLPFPVLDGGHILFLGVEKLRGKPLSIKTQEVITQGALILLIMFVLYVSYYDTMGWIRNLRK